MGLDLPWDTCKLKSAASEPSPPWFINGGKVKFSVVFPFSGFGVFSALFLTDEK